MKTLELIVVLLTIAAASRVCGQGPGCCTFETTDTCGWSTAMWTKSTAALPNTVAYPGFVWGSNFSWMQDNSGTIETTQVFTVVDTSTVFTFDYYFKPAEKNNGNYLHFFLNVGTVPTRKVLLTSVTESVDGWLHAQVLCSNANTNYCCGSRADIPCSGTIEVIGALPMSSGLLAIDNIGNCTASTSTTTPAVLTTTAIDTTTATNAMTTTTSTPIATSTTATATTTKTYPTQCCNFELGSCIWSSTEWFWSNDTRPVPPLPDHPGSYMWTTTKGAALESIMLTDMLESTVFTLVYYVKGQLGSDSLMVTFQQDAVGSSNVLATLTNTDDKWLMVSFDCSAKPTLSSPGCCTSYPCQGKASITATYTSPNCSFAVDDTGIDGDCGDSLPCCYFDDQYVCNFVNTQSPPDQWLWSAASTPNTAVVPNFTPTSGYVWYQVIDAPSAQLPATFRSPLITMKANDIIASSIFAYTDNIMNQNRIVINFHNANNDAITSLDYVINTPGSWATWTANCSSPHGECCSGQPTCTGFLEYTTTVVSGSAFYAIDAVSTPSPSGCSMPGQPQHMKNTQ